MRYNMSITDYINSEDAEERFDFESHVFENVFNKFAQHLPGSKEHEADTCNAIDVWYSEVSDEIMCRSEELAEMIADIINEIAGEKEAHTAYYDEEQDTKDDCVDDRTGWYCVDYE